MSRVWSTTTFVSEMSRSARRTRRWADSGAEHTEREQGGLFTHLFDTERSRSVPCFWRRVEDGEANGWHILRPPRMAPRETRYRGTSSYRSSRFDTKVWAEKVESSGPFLPGGQFFGEARQPTYKTATNSEQHGDGGQPERRHRATHLQQRRTTQHDARGQPERQRHVPR